MPGRASPFGAANGARGVFLWMPALPGLSGCSPFPSPNLPTRGRQRLAVSAPTLHGCPRVPARMLGLCRGHGLRGGPWAAWGLHPPCTARVNCWHPAASMG